MRLPYITAWAFASLAAARDATTTAARPTMTVPLINRPGDLLLYSYYGAVIKSVDDDGTVIFEIVCQNDEVCGDMASQTVTYGTSTIDWTFHASHTVADFHISASCDLDAPASMTCTYTEQGTYSMQDVETAISTTVAMAPLLTRLPIATGATLLPKGWTGYTSGDDESAAEGERNEEVGTDNDGGNDDAEDTAEDNDDRNEEDGSDDGESGDEEDTHNHDDHNSNQEDDDQNEEDSADDGGEADETDLETTTSDNLAYRTAYHNALVTGFAVVAGGAMVF